MKRLGLGIIVFILIGTPWTAKAPGLMPDRLCRPIDKPFLHMIEYAKNITSKGRAKIAWSLAGDDWSMILLVNYGKNLDAGFEPNKASTIENRCGSGDWR